jgi:SpoVK/Ycf46/Vps4 family AAA+-type ATPase
MLFIGAPGTGKSLAAAAVARAAQTDLLLVDVARLVSKWIGETEKNLAGAFDAAERTQAVLLLDEADVLFGTRQLPGRRPPRPAMRGGRVPAPLQPHLARPRRR